MERKPGLLERMIDVPPPVEADAVLNALSIPVVVLDGKNCIVELNHAGEHFLRGSRSHLHGTSLRQIVPEDSPLFSLVRQVREHGNAVIEHGINLSAPRFGEHFVNIHGAPLPERPDFVIVALEQRSIAEKIDLQMSHRGAARSVSAIARMLAHEVKNPLSGIRGAAQLLEEVVDGQDRALAQLIRGEVDRICALMDRMEVFSDRKPLCREAVNIHEVLTRVRQLAEHGFGRHASFVESYDPSLPPVLGDRDGLVQVFLNLVKNAAEAVSEPDGEIILRTAFRPGVRLAVPGKESREQLPLMIAVEDNGPGIAEDIRAYIFDPFVTTKPNGSGLGLALVAKIVHDHGGVIEATRTGRRTVMRVLLPMVRMTDVPAERDV
jgi:two-component system, NtrC family, nitrogen regulation sensor histidine kinase GlnL